MLINPIAHVFLFHGFPVGWRKSDLPEFRGCLFKFDGYLISGRGFLGFTSHPAGDAVSSMHVFQSEAVVDRKWQGAKKQRAMIVHVDCRCLNYLLISLYGGDQTHANA